MTSQELKDFIWYQDHYTEQARRATRAEFRCNELEMQIKLLKTYIKYLEARAYKKEEVKNND